MFSIPSFATAPMDVRPITLDQTREVMDEDTPRGDSLAVRPDVLPCYVSPALAGSKVKAVLMDRRKHEVIAVIRDP
jgi:hypothetical protein